MARPSKTGGKSSAATTRKASSAKGRNRGKTKRRIASSTIRQERPLASDLGEELKEAREQQAATADILKVVASSPSDVQPVFDAIAASANRLIGGFSTAVQRVIEDTVHLAAFTPTNPEADEALKAAFPRHRSELQAVALVENGETAQIADAETADPQTRLLSRVRGWRSVTFTPLMSQGTLIGFISCTRCETGVLAEHHVQLLRTFADQAVIAIENARLFNETQEALERQTATADILKVIASSPSDVQPVFEAIVRSAAKLFEPCAATITTVKDGKLHWNATEALLPGYDVEGTKTIYPIAFDPNRSPSARAILERAIIEIPDTDAPDTPEYTRRAAAAGGFRAITYVPLIDRDRGFGTIIFAHPQPGFKFSDRQLALVQTFADQAVIAIQNTRLFNETKEALAQQTATSDVLRVISSSVADTTPVFEKILDSCEKLFATEQLGIFVVQPDGQVHAGAWRGAALEAVIETLPRPVEQTATGIVIKKRGVLHFPSTASAKDLPRTVRDLNDQIGDSSMAWAPMLGGERGVGSICVMRRPSNPFSDKELALLKTFSDQAVIAIQNTRLFNEVQERTNDLSESLQQQTATADVLKVISRSAFDLQPVFDAIAENAVTLCEAERAFIFQFDGRFLRAVSYYNVGSEVKQFVESNPIALGRHSISARAGLEQRTMHVADIQVDPDYAYAVRDVDLIRTILAVPMLNGDELVGVITIYRLEVKPFTEKQVALVETFAAQAAIAVENTRLLDELRQSLQQQTATADVLKLISRSAFDLKTVLDTLVSSAARLCNAEKGVIYRREEEVYRIAALVGFPSEFAEYADAHPIQADRSTTTGRVAIERKTVHIPDVLSDADYTAFGYQNAGDYRTTLGVPLLREGTLIGSFSLVRAAVDPFTDRQIELVETFADQAVIAIENARLFEEVQAKTHELSEALIHQTGSSNILRVIASSPTNVEPVLEAIVESACQLCEADDAAVLLKNGDELRFSAHHGPISIDVGKWPINRGWVAGRAFLDQMPVHVRDLLSDEGDEFPDGRELSQHTGPRVIHSILAVPLLREKESIGAILLRRTEVQPFNEKQITLLQAFADQAVIAIGNVRLFEEVQQRTRELSESLEQQTATSEVLGVISRSAGDLEPVFHSMLENATRICGAQFGLMNLREGEKFRTVAFHNVPLEFLAARKESFNPRADGILAQIVRTGQYAHTPDLRATALYAEGDPPTRHLVDLAGARTILAVPMLKESELVGTIGIYRRELSPFNDKQIALLSNFASQAVIAIENTRLLKELRQRTDDLSQSLNELRTAQDRLIQTEKLASLGQLTAGIAHEIKNPLNFVNNFSGLSAELVEELDETLAPAPLDQKMRGDVGELTQMLKSNLEKVVLHGQRADSIVKNMLLHSREGSGERRSADINALVEESLNLAYHGARAENSGFNVTLRRDLDPDAGMIDLYPQEITRVFLNLVSNGFYAATKRKQTDEEGFDPTLTAATKSFAERVEIRIRDNGTGIPEEIKAKIFNPFFTTKPAGKGTGLGLSLSHDIIVKQHGGSIRVETELGVFTEFIITLPRATSAQNPERSAK